MLSWCIFIRSLRWTNHIDLRTIRQLAVRNARHDIKGPHVRLYAPTLRSDWLIDLRPCQRDDSYMDCRSPIKVHTDKWTQVHSAQSSLVVTHPRTNRARRYLTSVTGSPSKHWSPPHTCYVPNAASQTQLCMGYNFEGSSPDPLPSPPRY